MIQVGMKHKESVEVTWEMTAEKLGNEGVIVFSTPEMLSFLEITCRHCVEPHLKEGEGTVGISVDLKHIASTPIGINVTCECELIEVDGKRLVFNVELWDEGEKVGKAVHERFIVDMNKLLKKIDKKKEEYCKQ